MLRSAIKSLLGHKLRVFLTAFSIVLGVSFVAGTYIFTDSIRSTFNNLFGDVYAGIDITVRPTTFDFGENNAAIDADLLADIESIEGVEAVAPEVAGFAQIIKEDGTLIGGQGPPTLGFEWTTVPQLRAFNIEDGDGQEPTAAGEVVIDRATANTNDLAVGDTVRIVTELPAEEFTIVGIATFAGADGLAGATLSAFELREAQRLFGYDNSYSAVDIDIANDADTETVRASIDSILPAELQAITGEEQAAEETNEINEGLGFLSTALLVFGFISVLVGSFIIQNTFRIIVTQRSKELALLRAIGATKFQVVRMVLYEAAMIGLVASGFGIVLGAGIAQMIRALMNSVGFALPEGTLLIESRTIIVSVLVGVITTLISALLPAIKASTVAPVEAIRNTERKFSTKESIFSIRAATLFIYFLEAFLPIHILKTEYHDIKPLILRGWRGLILIAAGVVSLLVGLNGSLSQPIYAVGFGVFLQFIGIATIAPLLAGPIVGVIGWPIKKLRGITAKLAGDNARRTPRRTASTASALMIGVSLVTMLTIMASTFKGEITRIFDESFPADLTILSRNVGDAGPGTEGFDANTAAILSSVDGIAEVSSLRYGFQISKIDGATIPFIIGVDPATFDSAISLKASENAYESLATTPSSIVVNQSTLDDRGLTIGDTLTIDFATSGEQELEIVGAFTEAFDSDYLLSNTDYQQFTGDDEITLLAANIDEGADDTAVKDAVVASLVDYPQLDVQDKGDLLETAEQQIDQILALFWGLLGFAVVIAVLGITNTLMLSISERTRELGMLRAVGMTRTQMRRMIRYESIMIALFGAVLGIGMGAFFAWALLQALESEGISGYVFPVSQIVIYFLLAIVAGIIAAAWPARRAARMNVLDAIYHD